MMIGCQAHRVMTPLKFALPFFLLYSLITSCAPQTGDDETPVLSSTDTIQKIENFSSDENETSDDMECTHSGEETYQYWSGGYSSEEDNVEVLNGCYWSSSHFTKEYTLYMELIVPVNVLKHFPEDNGLERIINPSDSNRDFGPDWFTPPADFEVWGGQLGSRYFMNPKTGHMFMYEVQF